MKTRNIDINYINKKPLCITIGNFDGIHLGHKYIINTMVNESRMNDLYPTVLSFNPHPRKYFKKIHDEFNIILEKDKKEILNGLGVENFLRLNFDKKTSSLTAEEFVKKFLVKNLKLKMLIIGENFQFGKDRKGNINLLKKLSYKNNFSLKIIKSIKVKNSKIVCSSSNIRKNIEKGNIEKTNILLGRPWAVKGRVLKGDGRARKMNFPTANLFLDKIIKPKKGVYVVSIIFNSKKYRGIANFGRRPTFNGKKLLLEVNIFNFNKKIYGKELTVQFLAFIREEIKFKNFNKLKYQVKKDVKVAKSFFKNI